ncbi:MAG: energy transducer TonB [Terriglobales bacterium]
MQRKSAWQQFRDEFKDRISRKKQPELVLESKPIPVKSIWSAPKPLKSRLGSVALHVAVVGILMLPFWRPVRVQITKIMDQQIFVPDKIVAMPKLRRLSGGAAPAVQPKLVIQTPKVTPMVAPTTISPLQNALNVPSFGSVGPVSGPPGDNSGSNGGSGGTGTGAEGGTCVGADCGGGDIATDPVKVYDPDPQYSEAARKAKFQGTCTVQVTIGTDGRVSRPVVVVPLGLGLDEQAIKAVLQWKFIPAKDKSGRPLAVIANVEVTFRLF